MRELGHILRSTRESLGFDLDEIEEKTKIRKRYLLALEEGDWNVLPGRVYARGFVRNYAEVLGLDGLGLLQTYVDGRETDANGEQSSQAVLTDGSRPESTEMKNTEQKDVPDTESQPAPRKAVAKMADPRSQQTPQWNHAAAPKSEQKRRVRPNGAAIQAIVIVAALVVIGGGYLALRGHLGKQTSAGQQPPAGAVISNNTVSVAATNTTSNTTASTPVNNTTNTTTSVPVKTPPVTITPQPLKNGVRTYLVQNVSHLKVDMQVQKGACWIRVHVDGKVTDGNDTVNQGQTRHFHGAKTVELRLGHVQGVKVTVNGQVLTLPKVPSAVNILIQKK